MDKVKKLSFSGNHRDFSIDLNKRVNSYFKKNKINTHANSEMVIKTIFMFTLYVIPYILILNGTFNNLLANVGLIIIMSIGLAGIGLSVMHDANHGAYSKNKWLNTLIGYSLNVVGANSFNWKIQHNVLHHSFTNVYEEDEDISPRGVLRLTPYAKWKAMHRYQFIYAWFLYGLMTLVWLFFKDFERMIKYQRNGLVKRQNANIYQEWAILIITKILYISYIFVLPVILTPFVWWQVLLGIVLLHFIAGFILAIIFQSAHVLEETQFPTPNEANTLENCWAAHQLLTTANFAKKSPWFSWYVGGLNYQIEHHLFPNICHVHYRNISGIVESTAADYGLPYNNLTTFRMALQSHVRLLKQLGEKPTNSVNAQA